MAPDEKVFAYLNGKPRAPQGERWARGVEKWRELRSDPGAVFDREIHLDASLLELELTEPSVFLPYGEGAAARFADVLAARLRKP